MKKFFSFIASGRTMAFLMGGMLLLPMLLACDPDPVAPQPHDLPMSDAYVTDYTLLLNAIVKNPDTYEIAGDQFGPEDNYGIGLPLDSDGVDFVNDFLEKVIENGTWEKLWQISLGDRTGIESAPEAPVVEKTAE